MLFQFDRATPLLLLLALLSLINTSSKQCTDISLPTTTLETSIQAHPSLQEAYRLANSSGILDGLRKHAVDSPVTLFLPSDDAIRLVPKAVNEFLLNKRNQDLLDSLLLFSALDYPISDSDIQQGFYEDEGSIVTLLSESISISREGKLCVNQGKDCAHIIDSIEVPEEGNIFIIDRMLYPAELLAVLPITNDP